MYTTNKRIMVSFNNRDGENQQVAINPAAVDAVEATPQGTAIIIVRGGATFHVDCSLATALANLGMRAEPAV